MHGVDGNDAASLEVLSAGRELLEEATARVVPRAYKEKRACNSHYSQIS